MLTILVYAQVAANAVFEVGLACNLRVKLTQSTHSLLKANTARMESYPGPLASGNLLSYQKKKKKKANGSFSRVRIPSFKYIYNSTVKILRKKKKELFLFVIHTEIKFNSPTVLKR